MSNLLFLKDRFFSIEQMEISHVQFQVIKFSKKSYLCIEKANWNSNYSLESQNRRCLKTKDFTERKRGRLKKEENLCDYKINLWTNTRLKY